ncbi:MAG: tetratricopeptide repeat protein [Candidatus Acidiferrales bacterium]
MAVDIQKQLERAKRYLEKNKLGDAVEAYQSVLDAVPNHLEALQALGDLHARLGQFDRAATYFGLLFDRATDPGDEGKALALFSRFLKSTPQPAERVARYAVLLQRQNRTDEAIEQYVQASEKFLAAGKTDYALACLDRMAQLDSDNPARHAALGELAEQLGNASLAARGFLRSGQLAASSGDQEQALAWFARAHKLAPSEPGVVLLYAHAKLAQGDAAEAAALLEPFAATERHTAFVEIYGTALLRAGELDRARVEFEDLARVHPAGSAHLMEVVSQYFTVKRDAEALEVLEGMKNSMLAAHRENEFAADVDKLAEAHPNSISLAEFRGALYGQLNRESTYFDALGRLFDLYIEAGEVDRACETLERLVDVDAYDFRNQERLAKVEGKATPASIARIRARLQAGATHGAGGNATARLGAAAGTQAVEPEKGSAEQALEDLIVQAEIFVQYSLRAKAVERLEKIASLYPREIDRNERLRNLCKLAQWWPEGAAAEEVAAPSVAAEAVSAPSGDTMRDLTRISEIAQKLFRQSGARAMLSTVVNEVGGYLHATRCLAVVGAPGQTPQMAAEFCGTGVEPASGSQVVHLIAQIDRASPDPMGGLPLAGAVTPLLAELGLAAVLGVVLSDKETQTAAGMLLVGFAAPHSWRPHETYFLQSVGDQMLLGVNHTRLRSMMRNLAVADEKTGLLRRSSYQDCLLREVQGARARGTPLTVALVQLDRGPELLQQHGEAQLERHLEQVARAFQPDVRQNDLAVKYTAWALAFILPDTPAAGAQALAEKLRKTATGVRPPWDGAASSVSAAVAEAAMRPEYDGEDIVTELINRAEIGLERTRGQGGDATVMLAAGEY